VRPLPVLPRRPYLDQAPARDLFLHHQAPRVALNRFKSCGFIALTMKSFKVQKKICRVIASDLRISNDCIALID
jgi:hypothetical protein